MAGLESESATFMELVTGRLGPSGIDGPQQVVRRNAILKVEAVD